MDKVKLPYGLRKNRLYHISEVESGLECNCICPSCETQLVARKGPINVHHFAHHREKDCPGGLETAIHFMAKQIIYDHKLITTPGIIKETFLKDNRGKNVYGKKVVIKPTKLKLNKVEIELSQDGYRPDVVGYINGKKLFIEIKVTHEVDNNKKKLIENIKDPMIEIDLSKVEGDTFNDPQDFVKEVLFNKNNRSWINNPKSESIYQSYLAELRIKIDRINKRYELEERKKQKVESRRKSLRNKYSDLIEQIYNSYTDDWKDNRNQFFLRENEDDISKIKAKIGPYEVGKSSLFRENLEFGWIFETHPIVWQGAIFLKFIQSKSIDSSIEFHQVVRFIRKNFEVINFVNQLAKLNHTQKKPPAKYLTKSSKNGIWFLEDRENDRLIDYKKPIIDYLEYLSRLKLLKSYDFKTDSFKVRFNSLATLNAHIKELEEKKARRIKNKYIYETNHRIENEIIFNRSNSKKKLRIADIIKSEQRVLEMYGPYGSHCKKCMLTSHNKDGDNCPFCGNNDFKQIKITKEHLDVAHHKYQCNSSVTNAIQVKIDKTLLDEFDSKKSS